jgi:hypothetical protein
MPQVTTGPAAAQQLGDLARLRGVRDRMTLGGAGRGVDRADWASIVRAISEHTSSRHGESNEAAGDRAP